MRYKSFAGGAAMLSMLVPPAAQAAEIVGNDMTAIQRQGSFAGARLCLALGGPEAGRLRGGVTLAPTIESQAMDGRTRRRFGRGLELGFDNRGSQLSLAGRPIASSFAPDRRKPRGARSNVSTVGWVAIGVGAAALLYVGLFTLCQETNCTNSD